MRIAVVGSGISGLAAAWLLARAHTVTLFERAGRAGGHSNTVVVEDHGRAIPIDTGFIVYNTVTYPLLTRLFAELGVATQPSNMSFGVTCERCHLEYATTSIATLFAQPRRVLSRGHWQLIGDFPRFSRLARATLAAGDAAHSEALGAWINRSGLSASFANHFLRPMTAALWSAGGGAVDSFAVGELFRFYAHHGLLATGGRPMWRTVTGGARVYVQRLLDALEAAGARGTRVRLGAGVQRIVRDVAGATLTLDDGSREACDAVVIATHADEALALLGDASAVERSVLGAFTYATNEAVLHRDAAVLPRAPRARASWNNHVADCRAPAPRVDITYSMNRLQALPTTTPWSVTLNPGRAISPAAVAGRFSYTHPLATVAAAAARLRRGEINGVRRTWFAGAHWGSGFHEDGLRSGAEVARAVGVEW